MFKTLEEEWDNVLAYIKERYKIPDVSFNTWLLPLTLYSVNEFLVVKVMVPDVNYIGYIKKDTVQCLRLLLKRWFIRHAK